MSTFAAAMPSGRLVQRGLLTLAILSGSTGALFIYAGGDLRKVLGTSSFPSSEGIDPIVPGPVTAVVYHESTRELMQVSSVTLDDGPASIGSPAVLSKFKEVNGHPEQLRAEHLLQDATKAFTELRWDSARISAERMVGLDIDPKTQSQARDLIFKAAIISELFKRLTQSDELVRNLDTNPNLVEIVQYSTPIFLVPIDDKGSEVDGNAVEFIQQKMLDAHTGFFARIKSKTGFIKGQITGPISGIHPVDQAKVHADKESEFQLRYDELKNCEDAGNPLGWYELAKFAYRNRLDEHVPQLLENAIDLDPLLINTVREDRAGRLLITMIYHLKNHNAAGADSDLSKIRRDYADTENGKRASEFYNGNLNRSSDLAVLEQSRLKQAEAQRQELRLRHAQEIGDLETINAIHQAEHAAPTIPSPSSVNATPKQAAQAFTAGMDYFNKAVDLPSNNERNHLYRQAHTLFATSVLEYNALVIKNPEDESLQDKMTEAKIYMAASAHYQTEP